MRLFLLLVGLLLPTVAGQAQTLKIEPPKPVIVSPSHPKDSFGEIVYESQGQDQKDVPVVAGILLPPRGLKMFEPKYSRALKHERFEGVVTIRGVVTADGRFIDGESFAGDNAEAVACAQAALARYRFVPATLDGKPVAVIMKVVAAFKLNR